MEIDWCDPRWSVTLAGMETTTNRVMLSGRVSGDPESRTLPSGDVVASFRLVVPRDAKARRRSRVTVDTFDCSAWTAALRKKVGRLRDGDVIEIEGALRRQFSRGAHGVMSRVTVDLESLLR